MRAADIIRKKRDGLSLIAPPRLPPRSSRGTTGKGGAKWPDYQLSALLMAVVSPWHGFTRDGGPDPPPWSSPARSSTGPMSPALPWTSTRREASATNLADLAPLAAACGRAGADDVRRGLGHTGGTLDN